MNDEQRTTHPRGSTVGRDRGDAAFGNAVPVTNQKRRGGWRALVLLVGSLGPLGALPASGTVTVAVVGIPLYYLTHDWPLIWRLGLTAVITLISVWIHDRGDRFLGEQDSGRLVWDEICGFLVAVLFAHEFTWTLAIIAFLAERAFDILKVQPARWVEDHVPGGWGVVGDDLVAGAYTCLLLQGLVWFAPALLGVSP